MNWSSNWGDKPVMPEFAKPQLEKITEEAKQASEWVKTVSTPLVEISHEYETRSIKLGNKTIPVIVVGDLGLDFCEPGEKDESWNIIHLPTLASFNSAVPGYMVKRSLDGTLEESVNSDTITSFGVVEKFDYDKPELLYWMARVQENYPTSWQMLRLLTPDTYLDNGTAAKEIIQKWCLSVKVE